MVGVKKTWAMFVVAFCTLVACSVNISPQLLPGVRLDQLPLSSGSSGNELTQSKKDATDKKKKWVTNLEWATGLAGDIGVDPINNCVQLVQLSTDAVVIDFVNAPCPAGNGLAKADQIKATGTYDHLQDDLYEISVRRLSGSNGEAGIMKLDLDTPKIELVNLCNGNYQFNCYVSSQGSRIIDILLF